MRSDRREWWSMLTARKPPAIPQPWEIAEHFDARLEPLLLFVDLQTVYHVGLEALGYPPTWLDLDEEASTVEAAVMEFLRTKYNV